MDPRSPRSHRSRGEWRFFSLEEINRQEGKKHPWEREWSYGWSMMRTGALLRRRSMSDVDTWYERAGRALHLEGRKPHEKAVDRLLLDTLFFPDGQCLFWPVLIDPPTGDAALLLWDAVVGWSEFPQLYELQRPKIAADEARIAETFRSYLQARDWVSINRGEVVTFTD